MKVVVTGAGGAVGSYVVRQLVEDGHNVIAIDLPGVPVKDGKAIQHVPMNLVGKTVGELKPIVRSADAVIHTAAIVDIARTEKEVWPLNVVATRRLAIAASEEMFCKFIHISSGSIYAPSSKPIDEEHRLLYTSPYEKSKVHSEAAIHVVADFAADDFSWTILRPALIYGPKARFLGATLAAIPPIIKMLGIRVGVKGGPVTNWVHAEDVARAAVHCVTCDETNNRTFNVADDYPTPFGDTATDYMEAYGVRPLVTLPLPPLVALRLLKPFIDRDLTFRLINAPLGNIWSLVASLYGLQRSLSVKVDREASPYVFHNTVFDNSALKNTGFELRWPNHKEAIPHVLMWYKNNYWIP